MAKRAETYRHGEEALLRPDVGTQAQFTKKKAPKAYRYDSSLSPALEWDEQNHAREDLEKHLSADELFGLFGLEPPPSARGRTSEPPRYGGMTGEEFERHLGDLLRRLEWSVEPTQRSRDGGIDLKAAKIDRVGIETRLYVQCKNQGAPVSVEIVRELNSVLDPSVQGVIASPSGFTADARRFAEERGIRLWDGAHLAALASEAGVGFQEEAE